MVTKIIQSIFISTLILSSSLVAQSHNRFGVDLYDQLSTEKGNVLFSPYSAHTVLSMVYKGAKGKTEKEMSNVLHITQPQDLYHKTNAQLIKKLGEKSELSVANKIFLQKEFVILPDFMNVLKSSYYSGIESVDFYEPVLAADTINNWVAKKTNEKITDIVLPRHLSAETKMVLVNAIHFKSDWAKPFKKSDTHPAPFCLSNNSCTDVDMMMQTGMFNYMENDLLQMIELKYKNSSLSMYVLLPHHIDGLSKIEDQFTQAKLSSWMGKLEQKEITVKLPKFKIETSYALADSLSAMGMKSAFDCADFSGIDGSRSLRISNVLHKAFIEVEETGTEAAAATAVVIAKSFCRIPQGPVFNADHPFIFLIRDNDSGVVVFLGRLSAV